MKKLLLVSLLVSNFCFGQNKGLEFTEKFYDAVDKWVAFDSRAGDSTYIVGFIYVDMQAGFTFNYESKFTITNEGFKIIPEDRKSLAKYRLGENTANIAILSDEAIKQLGLPQEPDWLKYYKEVENDNAYFVSLGLHLNAVGASHKALEPLLKVYEQDPHFKGLEFELAYAYNATQQFDKAVDVLNSAIKNDPKNFWFYRELGFSHIHQNQPDDAEKAYLQGMELTTDKSQKSEMAFNMTSYYFTHKNRPQFEKWAKLTKQYADTNSQYYQYTNYFEENWDK